MKKLLFLVSAFIMSAILLVPVVGAAQSVNTAAIDSYITELMRDYNIPGVGLAVVQGGKRVYAQGYGVRDLRTGAPVTAETEFSIGSVSKSFTALAIAQLVDAGTLDLDKPVVDYVPDFRLSDPEATASVTLRNLLAQTSGLLPDLAWHTGELRTLQDAVDHAATLPIVAKPGTTFIYNNYNYSLAGYVLEQVTGQSWADYVREHIFEPLDMQNANTDFSGMQALENFAAPHMLDVFAGPQPVDFFPYFAPIAPAGAINANVLDMANYALLQLGDGTFKGQRIVSEAMLNEMHTTQQAPYALGWIVQPMGDQVLVWHNGNIDGFGALVTLSPAQNAGVVVLMNADLVEQFGFADIVAARVLQILAGTPDPGIAPMLQGMFGVDPGVRQAHFEAARAFTPDPASYVNFAGEYNGDNAYHVELRGDQLVVQTTFQGAPDEWPLVEFEPGHFIANHRGMHHQVVEFRSESNGSVTLLLDGKPLASRPS